MKSHVATVFITFIIVLTLQSPCQAESIYYTPPEKSKEELVYDLFNSLLYPHIDAAVKNYYSDLLIYSPSVYPYQVSIVNAKRLGGYRSYKFLITVKVTPVVGAHFAVGEERLTFLISPNIVELKEYDHLKTYELPEHLQDYLLR